MHGEALRNTLDKERAGPVAGGQLAAKLFQEHRKYVVLLTGHFAQSWRSRVLIEHVLDGSVEDRQPQIKVHHLKWLRPLGLPAQLVRSRRCRSEERRVGKERETQASALPRQK